MKIYKIIGFCDQCPDLYFDETHTEDEVGHTLEEVKKWVDEIMEDELRNMVNCDDEEFDGIAENMADAYINWDNEDYGEDNEEPDDISDRISGVSRELAICLMYVIGRYEIDAEDYTWTVKVYEYESQEDCDESEYADDRDPVLELDYSESGYAEKMLERLENEGKIHIAPQKEHEELEDGWHTICGYDVYVKNGCVMRGTKLDHNGHEVPAAPYVVNAAKYGGGWSNACGISVGKFRAYVKRDLAKLA